MVSKMLHSRRFRSRTLVTLFLVGVLTLVILAYNKSGIRSPEPLLWWGRCERMDEDAVDTGELYATLDFSVPEMGGYWNNELEKRYREIRKTWADQPLEVVITPHSHVDPGWLQTYDDYFDNFVERILDNMVEFLNKTEDFTFIWSEVSYFSKWWHRKNESVQNTVKQILRRKQLEIVTGGWVMTDEATTSYFGIVDQLVEGHQWLKHFTNITPVNGWSVDVFGHSASVPYILSLAGITDTVILRTHYAWKSFLAQKRWFDFFWKQSFHSPKIFTHMAPSELYSFKYVCGPDAPSCLKYDFRKINGELSESTADEITEDNIEMKSKYLVSQYGRYASLFPHNVLLVPLGDDFRYGVKIEWEQQYKNYKKVMNFINDKKDWNVRIRFGTVSDYFEEVKNRLECNESMSNIPSIKGDFFPYGDIYANARPSYWTGFYSTRPFYKKLAHELEHWLRASEIVFSFAKIMLNEDSKSILLKDYSYLTSARQSLALFLHHDAITGTSKKFVMEDYSHILHSGIADAMSVISHATQLLMMKTIFKGSTWTSQVYADVYKTTWNYPSNKLPVSTTINGRIVIIFNPLTTMRTEAVRIKIKSTDIKVVNSKNENVEFQINPIWTEAFTISNEVFELIFVVTTKPLSFSTYKLINVEKENISDLKKSIVSLYLKDDHINSIKHSAFKFAAPTEDDIHLESFKINAKFSSSGVLKEIILKEKGISAPVSVEFKAYLPWIYRSGGYLFQPDIQNPIPVSNFTKQFPFLCVIHGPVVSELSIMYNNVFKSSLRVYHFDGAPPGLQIEVSPDLAKLNQELELVMRINSKIESNGIFYTDSNGLQMLKRKYVSHLPVQGNYYPATSATYVEDNDIRLNLLVPHSHGVTSTLTGSLEIMLDRRIGNDDGRGMGEGIEDNQMISSTFWLVLQPQQIDSPASLSSEVYRLSLQLQYPVIAVIKDNNEVRMSRDHIDFLSKPWPPDVHLVNLRTLSTKENYAEHSNSSLMIIHERFKGCETQRFIDKSITNYRTTSFSEVKVKQISETSLTGNVLRDDAGDRKLRSVLQSCIVTFKRK